MDRKTTNIIDIKDVIEFREKKIILPPALLCPVWEGFIDIMTVEKMFLMHAHLLNKRHNWDTPIAYLMKNCAFKLYYEGHTPMDAEALFNLPLTSARRYYKQYQASLQQRVPNVPFLARSG